MDLVFGFICKSEGFNLGDCYELSPNPYCCVSQDATQWYLC